MDCAFYQVWIRKSCVDSFEIISVTAVLDNGCGSPFELSIVDFLCQLQIPWLFSDLEYCLTVPALLIPRPRSYKFFFHAQLS